MNRTQVIFVAGNDLIVFRIKEGGGIETIQKYILFHGAGEFGIVGGDIKHALCIVGIQTICILTAGIDTFHTGQQIVRTQALILCDVLSCAGEGFARQGGNGFFLHI